MGDLDGENMDRESSEGFVSRRSKCELASGDISGAGSEDTTRAVET